MNIPELRAAILDELERAGPMQDSKYDLADRLVGVVVDAQLCQDEGCPQHGTKHICINDHIPPGYKLLKDSTIDQRSYPDDQRGKYFNHCTHCGRQFLGPKNTLRCRVCSGE